MRSSTQVPDITKPDMLRRYLQQLRDDLQDVANKMPPNFQAVQIHLQSNQPTVIEGGFVSVMDTSGVTINSFSVFNSGNSFVFSADLSVASANITFLVS